MSASTQALALTLTLLALVACSGGSGGSPTGPGDDGSSSGAGGGTATSTPTAPTPQGCSGTAVGRVEINVNLPATIEVFDETFVAEQASGQSPYRITRNVVPCEYVMTGTWSEPGAILFSFLRTAPYERDQNPGGIERASIVVEQGTGGLIAGDGCQLSVSSNDPRPATFRIRFRVGSSNEVACL